MLTYVLSGPPARGCSHTSSPSPLHCLGPLQSLGPLHCLLNEENKKESLIFLSYINWANLNLSLKGAKDDEHRYGKTKINLET
jgi:hypothetical protein